jgi:chromosome partitioning protein
MSRVIAVANQKGGVGKTTTAINLAANLANLGQECLLIDMDPQSNATSGLGIDKNKLEKSIYNVLVDEFSLENILQNTLINFLSVAPATTELSGAEVDLVNMENREKKLKFVLERPKKIYKYIIIDCSPSLELLTINALIAADTVLIPMQCEFFALEGMGQLSKTIFTLMQRYDLDFEGILFTMFDSRTNLAGQVVEEVKSFFKDKVYETKIPRTIKLAEAPSFGKPALIYDPFGKGSLAYMDFTKEFLLRQKM